MAFSPVDAAFEGFRLAKRSPLTILIWALFYVVLVLAILAVAGGSVAALMQAAADMPAGGEPSEAQMAAFLGAYFGFLGLIMPISLVLGAIAYAAVNRAVLRPSESAFGYIRLGLDEVRVFVVSLVLSLIIGMGFGVAFGGGGGVIGVLAVAAGDAGWIAGIVGFFAILAGLCALIWVSVRLSLALPITVAEKRMAFFDSWALTKGRFWNLLGMVLLAYVLTIVVQILLSIVLLPILFFATGGFSQLAALEGMAPADIFRTMAPFAIIVLVFSGLMSALQLATMYAPFAAAYRGLKEEEQAV